MNRFNVEVIFRTIQSVLWEIILVLVWTFIVLVDGFIVNHLQIVWGLHIAFGGFLIINIACFRYIQQFNNNGNLVSVERLLNTLKKHIKQVLC